MSSDILLRRLLQLRYFEAVSIFYYIYLYVITYVNSFIIFIVRAVYPIFGVGPGGKAMLPAPFLSMRAGSEHALGRN